MHSRDQDLFSAINQDVKNHIFGFLESRTLSLLSKTSKGMNLSIQFSKRFLNCTQLNDYLNETKLLEQIFGKSHGQTLVRELSFLSDQESLEFTACICNDTHYPLPLLNSSRIMNNNNLTFWRILYAKVIMNFGGERKPNDTVLEINESNLGKIKLLISDIYAIQLLIDPTRFGRFDRPSPDLAVEKIRKLQVDQSHSYGNTHDWLKNIAVKKLLCDLLIKFSSYKAIIDGSIVNNMITQLDDHTAQFIEIEMKKIEDEIQGEMRLLKGKERQVYTNLWIHQSPKHANDFKFAILDLDNNNELQMRAMWSDFQTSNNNIIYNPLHSLAAAKLLPVFLKIFPDTHLPFIPGKLFSWLIIEITKSDKLIVELNKFSKLIENQGSNMDRLFKSLLLIHLVCHQNMEAMESLYIRFINSLQQYNHHFTHPFILTLINQSFKKIIEVRNYLEGIDVINAIVKRGLADTAFWSNVLLLTPIPTQPYALGRKLAILRESHTVNDDQIYLASLLSESKNFNFSLINHYRKLISLQKNGKGNWLLYQKYTGLIINQLGREKNINNEMVQILVRYPEAIERIDQLLPYWNELKNIEYHSHTPRKNILAAHIMLLLPDNLFKKSMLALKELVEASKQTPSTSIFDGLSLFLPDLNEPSTLSGKLEKKTAIPWKLY